MRPHEGLSPFGERVVQEMNRLGMLVDISHVSPATMADVLRVSQAPVIASHSRAYAIAPRPRNVPDEILEIAKNGGVIMVNFFSGFIVAEAAQQSRPSAGARTRSTPTARVCPGYGSLVQAKSKMPRGTIKDVADHIDHIVKVAGIDHVGIGSDFDGITSWPVGLEDVSCYPRLTEELLRGATPKPTSTRFSVATSSGLPRGRQRRPGAQGGHAARSGSAQDGEARD